MTDIYTGGQDKGQTYLYYLRLFYCINTFVSRAKQSVLIFQVYGFFASWMIYISESQFTVLG